MSMLEHFHALDAALVAAGFPVTSPWWLEQVERFYATGVRRFVGRVGRRGGKSSTWCRVAVVEALYGEHAIPPGDVGIVGIVSVSRDEAAARLRTIKAILDALHVGYREAGETIELTARSIVFRVHTCSIRGVVGGTWVFALCDEVAYWRDAETGANPATEVLDQLTPTMATQPHAKLVLLSAPLGYEDAHAKAFEAGDTNEQIVAHAPTWVANPTISEARTHELARDQRVWSRAYAAIPQAGRLNAFDVDAIDRAFARAPSGEVRARAMILDPSSGRKDAWSWALVSVRRIDATHTMISFDEVCGFEGAFFAQDAGDVIVDHLAKIAHERGVRSVFADQRESLMLASAFSKRKLSYEVCDWTSASKPEAVERVRTWLRDGTIALCKHDRLRTELLAFEERITPSGAFTFGARGSGHDDYVALLLTTALAEIAGSLVAHTPLIIPTAARRAIEADRVRRNALGALRGPESWFGGRRGF